MTESHDGTPATPEQVAAVEFEKTRRAYSNGANWFYWIAGLSIVNSLIALFEGGMGFIFGLGITQIVDGVAMAILDEVAEGAGIIRIIALVTSAVFAGIFALFGWLANRGLGWAFIVGMVLYLMDGLLFLLFGDWLSLAFHGFALYSMFNGYRALGTLRDMEVPAPQAAQVDTPA